MRDRKLFVFSIVTTLILTASAAGAETASARGTPTKPAAAPVSTPVATANNPASKSAVSQVKKVRARHWTALDEPDHYDEAGLGDWIELQVTNLESLVGKPGQKPLALYINGLELPGIEPVFVGRDGPGVTLLRFHLERTDKSAAHWAELLGKPDATRRQVEVSIAPEGCGPDCRDMATPAKLTLIVIRDWGLAAFVALMLIVLWLLWRYGRDSMLRDNVLPPPQAPPLPAPGAAPAPLVLPAVAALPANLRPFSLGRCQMAFWFILVVAAFLFIWLVTGNLSSLTASVLGLIGISAGTALGAVTIDSGKRDAELNELQQMVADRNRLQAQVSLLAAAVPPSPSLGAAQMQLADIDSRLANWRSSIRQQTHRSLLMDILSDDGDVSFHRLQILGWTLVLGVVFVAGTLVHLEMPSFDAPLLALMGISSGTYLGFKFPEKQA